MSLGVIKEWHCIEHGEFERSHPICPALGCRSESVVREFRTAPSIGTRMVKQHEIGIKRSSDLYHINDFRSARASEASYGGNTSGVLWGDECRKVFGRGFSEMVGMAQAPIVPGGSKQLNLNSGMRGAMTESPALAQRARPKPGEMTYSKGEAKSAAVATELTK